MCILLCWLEAVSGCLLCGRAGGLGHSDHTGKVPVPRGRQEHQEGVLLSENREGGLGWGRGHTEACVTG